MSEMSERIVLALSKLPIRDNLERGGELDQLRLREAARAVIEAMRNPTAEMLYFGIKNQAARKTWNLMIDALLRT